MAQLRRDPINGRWVIVETEKVFSISDFDIEKHIKKDGVCPFCYGHEAMTPPEIVADRPGNTRPNTPGWSVRVVPNKFPALEVEGDLNKIGIGIFDMMNGIGAHEVIIESPDHDRNLGDLPQMQIEKIIYICKERGLDLKKDRRFKYLMLFKNFGISAGASLEHPHIQLIALPMIPKTVADELRGASDYYGYKERCVYCDIIAQEFRMNKCIVSENKTFLSFVPFSARFPFEVWIIPKNHLPDFNRIQPDDIKDLARILKEILLKIKVALNDPSYNFIIHTSPLDDKEHEEYHWHIEIMPKLVRTAGFEWGSGFYVNTVAPEQAAKLLGEAKI